MSAKRLAFLAGGSFAVGLSGALVPGSMLAVTVAAAARLGWLAGPAVVAGHGLLELAAVLLIARGLGRVLARPRAFAIASILGAAALLASGTLMILTAGSMELALEGSGPEPGVRAAGSLAAAVALGAVSSLANPYWSIWWATIGTAYAARAREAGRGGVPTFFAGHLLADLVWYSLVAWAVGAGRGVLSLVAYQWVIRGCGLFLVALALWFTLAAVRRLRARRSEAGADAPAAPASS